MSKNARVEPQLNIDKYIRNSKQVDISDLDLSQATRYPLSDDEIRALTYMCDIESHTVVTCAQS